MHFRLLMLLLIVISGSGTTLAQTKTPSAIVDSVVGKGLKKDTKDSTKIDQLKAQDELFAGQWVSCATGCKQLIISFCKVPTAVRANPKWKQILAINCPTPKGIRGGGRSEVGILRSPVDSEVIRPATFSLKWDRSAISSKMEVSLRVMNGERIWGPYEVEGRKGSFTSDSLRTALAGAQAAGQLKLELSATHGAQETEKIELDVISADEEADLEQKLEQFELEPNKIVKAIGRASVFGQFDLIASEVKEFERALAIATIAKVGKRTLSGVKKLTIIANWKANNTERVKELCRFGPPTPEAVCTAK